MRRDSYIVKRLKTLEKLEKKISDKYDFAKVIKGIEKIPKEDEDILYAFDEIEQILSDVLSKYK